MWAYGAAFSSIECVSIRVSLCYTRLPGVVWPFLCPLYACGARRLHPRQQNLLLSLEIPLVLAEIGIFLLLLLLTSHNSSVLFPVFFFLIFFFFSMPVTDPRCQIAAAAGCMTDPLGCSWVNTPGLILAVSYRWYADDFSDLSCFSNASSFFFFPSFIPSLLHRSWKFNLGEILRVLCTGSVHPKDGLSVHYSFYITKWFN